MDIVEELRSAGVLPTGPVSAWPEERNKRLLAEIQSGNILPDGDAEVLGQPLPAEQASRVRAGIGGMASGLVRAGAQAIRHGKVSKEIREERYNTCKTCPAFIKQSKRCSDCGCFMEAKTWVGGDPNMLCPQKKWSR